MKLFIMLTLITFSVFGRDVVLEKDNFLIINDQYNSETMNQLKAKAFELSIKKGIFDSVYLLIDSPGGEISSGLDAIDFLNTTFGDDIKTISFFSASMGFQTVQSLGERLIPKSGILMAHKARGGFEGEFGDGDSQLDKRYQLWMNRMLRLDQQAVSRTNGKHTLQSFRKLMENEYWCEGQTCVNDGFADSVVGVRCGNSLTGFEVKEEKVNYFGIIEVNIEYKQPFCPLIQAYDVKVIKGELKIKLNDSEIHPKLRQLILETVNKSNLLIRNNK